MPIKPLMMFGFLLLTGCISAPVAPNLTFDKLAIKHPSAEKVCPTLVMPAIPEDVELSISGQKVRANSGGERLLRYYVNARELLRP